MCTEPLMWRFMNWVDNLISIPPSLFYFILHGFDTLLITAWQLYTTTRGSNNFGQMTVNSKVNDQWSNSTLPDNKWSHSRTFRTSSRHVRCFWLLGSDKLHQQQLSANWYEPCDYINSIWLSRLHILKTRIAYRIMDDLFRG